MPAITNQAEGDPEVLLEVSAKGWLMGLRTASLEVSKALATMAIPRLP